MNFAKNLKKLRLEKGLSQQKLADWLKVAQSTIGMWETGKRVPSLNELTRIAQSLDITIGSLLGQKEKKLEVIKNEVHVDGQKINELDAFDVEAILSYIQNLKNAKRAISGKEESTEKTQNAKKILIIDDEKGMCESLYSFLAPHNYRVFLTFNGQMGLEYFDEIKPDAVLLDLSLPDMAGIEVLKTIRKISSVPVLIITAHPEDIADIHLKDLAINGYLEKPFLLKEVLNTLRHIVGG